MKHPLPRHILLLLAGTCLQFSCSQMQQKQEPAQPEQEIETAPPLYLGSVHQVFPADQFALLRIIGPMPREGTVLITHPADGSTARMANLIVSSAQHARNNFVAADIRAGVVAQGDRVYEYRSIAAPIEPEEEEPLPSTLSGEELDLGYIPPAVQALREKARQAQQAQEETETEPEPVIPATVLPEEEEDAPGPQLPTESGLPRFDDIPDTINGWDSM